MATSRNTGHSSTGTRSWIVSSRLASLSRYDVVLAAVPLVFAVALAAHALTPVSFHFSVTTGAVTSVLLLVDVLFLNPPAGDGSNGPTH